MLSSRAVATTDGATSLHKPVFVVVFSVVVVLADDACVLEVDEHALAKTIRPATAARESRWRWFRTAAEYTCH
jgi:hypothetical protein